MGKPHSFMEHGCCLDKGVGLKKVEQVFENGYNGYPKDGTELWDSDSEGDDIEAYNNRFNELAIVCPELGDTVKEED
ncbi:hypothetical protein Tco_1193212 [Tanacetum coccineum]